MPELPEVSTIAKQIDGFVKGYQVEKLDLYQSNTFRIFNHSLVHLFVGATLTKVTSLGKNIIFFFTANYDDNQEFGFLSHLGMSGLWLDSSCVDKYPKYGRLASNHTHLRLSLQLSKSQRELLLVDPRRFGHLTFFQNKSRDKPFLPRHIPILLDKVGPDILKEVKLGRFIQIVRSSSRPIKTVLLDQTKVSGFGAIYADEALFSSKICPFKQSNHLTDQEVKNLYECAKELLKRAIKLKGSTLKDKGYVDLFCQPGRFQYFHKVYQKDLCPQCGGSIINSKLSGRRCYFCPNCQKLK